MARLGLVKSLWGKVNDDDILGLSAQMSFFFVLAMFPFLISLAALVSVLPFTGLWNNILSWIILYLPAASRHLIFQTITGVTQNQEKLLSIGLVGTVWAATGGIMSLISALNVVYRVKETRGYIYRMGVSFLMLVILTILFLGTFGLLAMGDLADARLARLLHSTYSLPWLWHIGRWVLSFILTAIAIAIIDNVLPNQKLAWRWVRVGSLFTVIAWVLITSGFNFYVYHVNNYQHTYGDLSTFIVFMVWIYIVSFIILMGAEINWQIITAKISRPVNPRQAEAVYPGGSAGPTEPREL